MILMGSRTSCQVKRLELRYIDVIDSLAKEGDDRDICVLSCKFFVLFFGLFCTTLLCISYGYNGFSIIIFFISIIIYFSHCYATPMAMAMTMTVFLP